MFKEGEGKGNGKGDRARARAKQCRKFQGKLTFDQQRKKHHTYECNMQIRGYFMQSYGFMYALKP